MTGGDDGVKDLSAAPLIEWARRVGLGRKSAFVLTVVALIFGFATYAALTGAAPFGPDPRLIRFLLLGDLVLLLALGAIVARNLVALWVERRRGSAGSRLHTRMAGLFSLVAVAPAILVALFSVLFFNLGIQGWFSDRVKATVRNSLAVAEAYMKEHRQNIRADALAMANDLNRAASLASRNPARFNRLVEVQVAVRSLSEALVFEASGRVLARSGLSFLLEFDKVPPALLEKAASGEVVVLTPDNEDRVRALIRLDRFLNTYLIVGRAVESRVLNHLERTRRAVAAYERLEEERSGIEITFVLIFIVVALLLLLAAVWFGLSIATRIVRPVGSLVGAAERVRQGDFSARVAEGPEDDEIGTLSRAFNRMTSQLASQRSELVEANRQLDERRRFTEAVLAGVSAGVIGLDRTGRIDLPNRSATLLLGTDAEELIGRPFAEAVPEMAPLLEEARAHPDRLVQGQVNIVRGDAHRNLLVRVATEQASPEGEGFVVTFDDITELVTAQRTSAWADVARRIAHEIKNPLTPIQLSAERLKRKYMREIESDPAVFAQCTDTIVRQVADIGRMVDEFSSFARMPAPVFEPVDVADLVRQEIFQQELAHPEIAYACRAPESPVIVRCDGRQVARALTNLLQNAAEAIDGRSPPPEGAPPPGLIEVELVESSSGVIIEVRDNGRGLPAEGRDRLTEPYMTTRLKGTGLGLAIVRKIMEEHGGKLELRDGPDGGACVRMAFPVADRGDGAERVVASRATG